MAESHGAWGDGATRIESDPPTFGPTPLSGLDSSSSTAGVLGPGQQFGTRYQVLKVLGQGGMGVVYRAWDEELGVAVALKVIRPEMMGTPDAAAEIERRFKQELILARQVTHKHVVRIHDLGDVNGIKYITMPFLEGEDLHATIAAAGKLPVRRALNIARQAASGLEAAHAVGVIHRDLKPANVMIDADDQAVILDFGIARSTSASTMTSGAVVGTLQYMAPEQAEGRSVDQRADIYALGLVLYDMLAGTRRLAATERAISDLMARLKAAPRPIREVEPLVPDALTHIISRCLEPDPAQRFQTTTELLTALDALDAEGHVRAPVISTDGVSRRSIVVAAIVAIALLGSLTLWIARRPAPAAAVARDPVSVLIADFDNRTGDEIFDGSLEQALGLGVEGSSFVTAFSRREARRAADQIKPGARIDEGIARLVAQREGIERMTEREKYRTFGAYYMQIARGYDKAIENYQALVDRYPADSARHNNLAVAYFSVLDFARAREEGEKLLAIYPGSVLYRYNYALYAMYAGDFAAAAVEAEKALAINPATHRPYVALAWSAIAQGQVDQARAVYEKARAAAGRQGGSLAHIGLADLTLFEGRFADAVPILTAGIDNDTADKNQVGAALKLVAIAEAQAALGEHAAVVETLQRAQALARPAEVLVPAALMLANLGRTREVEEIGKTLDAQLPLQPRAYGRLIAARLAMSRKDFPGAVQSLRERRKLADLWLLRYWLGIAYIEAQGFPQALSELETCEKRSGEATAVFLNDVPSWRYTAHSITGWLGRAKQRASVPPPRSLTGLSWRSGRPAQQTLLQGTLRGGWQILSNPTPTAR